MAKGFKNLIDAQAKLILDIDDSSSRMLSLFGMTEKMSQSMRAAMTLSLDAIQDMGGTLEDVNRLQTGVANSLGRAVTLSADGAKDLYASYKVTNIEVDKMVSSMADVGISAYNTASEMKKVVDIARESGVNAQVVSAKVIDNMKYLNQFNFEGGVSGLAKMAAQASMLRIDMKSTLDFAEKVYNPEGAIETAAALQRLGVTQSALLDPLKLLDLSQNDPAELQNQIAQMSKQFVKLKEDGSGFEIMKGGKRQMQEIAKAMGMPYAELTKMALAGADLDKKMKEISFPSDFANEEDKKLIANMAEMGKEGKYQVTIGDETKDVDKLTKDDFAKLKEAAEKGPPTMEDLAKQQLSAQQAMAGGIAKLVSTPAKLLAKSYTGDELLTLAKNVMPSINDSLKNAKPTPLTANELGKSLDEMVGGGKSIVDFMMDTTKSLLSASDNFVQAMDKLTNKMPLLSNGVQQVIDKISGVTVRQGRDVLKMPNEEIQLLPEDTFAAFTKGNEVLSNLTGSKNNNNNTPSSTNSTVDLTHTLNINITAPSNINTDQVIAMFNDTGVSQALGIAVKDAFTNGGLTTTNPNKQQLRNPGVLQYS
jgi:hypothetical protein